MRKYAIIFSIILAALTMLSACVPSQGLEGGAGQGQGQGNQGNESTSNYNNQNWSAEYQITTPRYLQVDEIGTIKLTIIPDTLPIEKVTFKSFEPTITQAIEGKINFSPYLIIKITSEYPLVVTPEITEIKLNSDKATIWQWNITALEAINQKIIISISSSLNGEIVVNEVFDLSVINPTSTAYPPTDTPIPPTATPYPTTTPSPSPTPLPPITTQLYGNAGVLITGVVITLIGAVATGYVTLSVQRKLKKEAEKKERKENETKRKEKEAKFKKDLPKGKNKK
jgi:hypothetical protein